MSCIFNCEEFKRYEVNLPYPPIVVSEQNHYFAQLISGAFAGEGSESTAITQYTFHNFFTENYPDVHEALYYISVVETIHLNLLGQLIKQLGCRPIFASYENHTFWNGRYPDYSTQIGEMLCRDIQGECDAIAHYKRIIRQIPDERITNVLRRIILDEEKHIEILTPLYRAYK